MNDSVKKDSNKEKDILYIVMPAYNEQDNIEEVVRSWYPVLQGKNEKSRLVVADAGSTDKTHEILQNLQKELPQLDILENTLKQHGPKVLALYQYGVDQGADYLFQTDSDGQTNPDEFDAFWNLRNQYDAILGHRNNRKDGASRVMVERVVCLLLLLFFGVRVPDANAPFRLIKSAVLAKYLPYFKEDYALPNIILSAFFKKNHEKLDFETISFENRKKGVNSINIKKIMGIGFQSLKDFAGFRKVIKVDQ